MQNQQGLTAYDVLGVNPGAPGELIATSYWQRVTDLQALRGESHEAEAALYSLTRAYEFISDPKRRSDYNAVIGYSAEPLSKRRLTYGRLPLTRRILLRRPLPIVDYYEVIGLAPGASERLVEEAYRIMRDQYLRIPPGTKRRKELLALLREAHALLLDEQRRVQYDARRNGHTPEAVGAVASQRAEEVVDEESVTTEVGSTPEELTAEVAPAEFQTISAEPEAEERPTKEATVEAAQRNEPEVVTEAEAPTVEAAAVEPIDQAVQVEVHHSLVIPKPADEEPEPVAQLRDTQQSAPKTRKKSRAKPLAKSPAPSVSPDASDSEAVAAEPSLTVRLARAPVLAARGITRATVAAAAAIGKVLARPTREGQAEPAESKTSSGVSEENGKDVVATGPSLPMRLVRAPVSGAKGLTHVAMGAVAAVANVFKRKPDADERSSGDPAASSDSMGEAMGGEPISSDQVRGKGELPPNPFAHRPRREEPVNVEEALLGRLATSVREAERPVNETRGEGEPDQAESS